MIWLALWCGSGAIVGSVVGSFTGRPGVGTVLGTFAGPLGWLMLLGAEPRARAVRASPDVPASTAEASCVEDAEIIDALSPQPLSCAASASAAGSSKGAKARSTERSVPNLLEGLAMR